MASNNLVRPSGIDSYKPTRLLSSNTLGYSDRRKSMLTDFESRRGSQLSAMNYSNMSISGSLLDSEKDQDEGLAK